MISQFDKNGVYKRMTITKGNEDPNEPRLSTFESGATRSDSSVRIDPEGYLSPIVLSRFCEYMNKHRLQADGTSRNSDNWQKGLPLETYIKSAARHFLHLWIRHRGFPVTDPFAAMDIEEDLCALMFNVQGYLFELLRIKSIGAGQLLNEEADVK